ncbi:MAG: hypothetical protein ACRDIU_07355 [Actinomycetota bacterium]
MNARTKLVAFGAIAVVLFAAGLAWACTEAAGISLGTSSGPAGTPVTITGKAFAPGPVEIRWNSSDGQLIGTADGPDFSVQVTPPAGTRADVFYVVAIQNGTAGNFKATETFEVTGPAGAASGSTSNELWSGFSRSAPAAEDGIRTEGPGSSALAGAGLLAAGAVALIGSLAVALVARRKAESR